MFAFAGKAGLATPAHQAHILCADDDPALRFTITFFLTRAGYNVTTVKDGAEAWEALQIDCYDLLITDQEMPLLDGVELVTKGAASRNPPARHPRVWIPGNHCKSKSPTSQLRGDTGKALHRE